MANTSSAKKAYRASLRKRVFNLRRQRAMRDAIKSFTKLTAAGGQSVGAFSKAQQAIDKATKRGVIKKNTAARMKSRLAKQLRTTA